MGLRVGSVRNSVDIRVWALITPSLFEATVTSLEIRAVVSLTAVVSLFKEPAGCLSLEQGPVKAPVVADRAQDVFSCCTEKQRGEFVERPVLASLSLSWVSKFGW